MTRTLLAVLALALPMTCGAQGVWRCGPEGRSYADTPCKDGRPLDLPTDARPAADIQAAQDQAARDVQQADVMRRERLAQEARLRGNGLAALGPQAAQLKPAKPDRRPTKTAAQARRQLHPEAPGTWRAVAPVSRRTKD